MSEQQSQPASFGGGAPIVSHISERSDADSQQESARHDSAEGAERQESPPGESDDRSDDDGSDPMLEVGWSRAVVFPYFRRGLAKFEFACAPTRPARLLHTELWTVSSTKRWSTNWPRCSRCAARRSIQTFSA